MLYSSILLRLWLLQISRIRIAGYGKYGTKVESIVQCLLHLGATQTDAKALVFSQYRTNRCFLLRPCYNSGLMVLVLYVVITADLLARVAFALRENRMAYVNLAGHRSARAEAIAFFNHSEQCVARVMLMCLKHDNSGMPKCALRNTSNIRTQCDSCVIFCI